MIETNYEQVYRGPARYSLPDNSRVDLEKNITGLGWCPFTASKHEIKCCPLLADFLEDNANNILPYQE